MRPVRPVIGFLVVMVVVWVGAWIWLRPGPPPKDETGPIVDSAGKPIELPPVALAPATPPDAPGRRSPTGALLGDGWLQLWFGRSDGQGTLKEGETVWATQVIHTTAPDDSKPLTTDTGCDVAQVRRVFRLESDRVFLGEPILLSYSVINAGGGSWFEWSGGAYRFAGRDENFFFLLRHEDGSWEPTALSEVPSSFGGLAGADEVKSPSGHELWFALQPYVDVTRPGQYTLHCFHLRSRTAHIGHPGALVELAKHTKDDEGKPWKESEWPDAALDAVQRHIPPDWSRPLARIIPASALSRGQAWELAASSAHARFTLQVDEPSEAQRAAFVQHWSAVVGTRANAAPGDDRAIAVNNAILLDRHPAFMPLLERWLAAETNEWSHGAHQALARRATPKAIELLLATDHPGSLEAMSMLPPEAVPSVVEYVIDHATADDDGKVAHGTLMRWAGDYRTERTQREWKDWWAKRKGTAPRRINHYQWEWPAAR